MEKMPTLMLLSSVVLFLGAVVAFVLDQPVVALVLLGVAIADAGIAMWFRGRVGH